MAITHTQQIFMGISKVEIAPKATISDVTPWEEIFYTVRDSVKFTQPAPTRTDQEVDQLSVPIFSVYKAGVSTLEMDVPDVSKTVLDKFYNTSTPSFTESGFETVGLNLGADVKQMMIRVTSGDGSQKLILTNASIAPNLDLSTPNTKAMVVHLSFVALAPDTAVNPEPFYLATKTGAAIVLHDWVKYGTSSAGAGLSDTFVAGTTTYIGVSTGHTSSVESTDPTVYKWYPI